MTGTVSKWTHRFVIVSALSMGGLQAMVFTDAPVRELAFAALLGPILPMIFGMGYLLFPSYVGSTLRNDWAPPVHLGLCVGGGVLILAELRGYLNTTAGLIGAGLWAGGVGIFLGALALSIAPHVSLPPRFDRSSGSQRSSRLGLLAVPLAMVYLVLGTVALLILNLGGWGSKIVTQPQVIHLLGTGVVVLLIMALGLKLLVGFLHVTPPHSFSWIALAGGSLAPAILVGAFYEPPWFWIGAGLEGLPSPPMQPLLP